MPKKHKPIRNCPEQLQRVIDAVNVLYGDAPRSPLFPKNEKDEKNTDSLYRLIEKYIDSLEEEPFEKGKLFNNRNILAEASQLLFSLAETNETEIAKCGKNAFKDGGLTFNEREQIFQSRLPFNEASYTFVPNFKTNKDGIIGSAPTKFGVLLEKIFIPWGKIRKCPTCKRIFWAKRTNAKTCGNQNCLKFNSKTYRERNRDQINKNRMKKYWDLKKL